MLTSRFYPVATTNFTGQMPRLSALSIGLLVASVLVQPLSAQQRGPQARGELKAPRKFELDTADGVVLNCHFYPGGNEKETVPIILLHQWDQANGGKSMLPLAGYLQRELGCAVLVPDLRGHGDSVRVRGLSEDLVRDRFRPAEVLSAIKDIETCKKFLMGENNKGELNIDLLTLVARGETCLHALHWTLQDWSFPPLGGVKQGQDVKGLVLISPSRSFKGLKATDYVRNPLFNGQAVIPLPIMIAADLRSSSSIRDADNIHDDLERFRESDPDDPATDTLKYYTYRLTRNVEIVPSSNGDRPFEQVIGKFIQDFVVAKKDEHRWQDRSSKQP